MVAQVAGAFGQGRRQMCTAAVPTIVPSTVACCTPSAMHMLFNISLFMQVYDHDADGSHDLIGRAETSLSQLQAAAEQGQALPLINPRKQGRPGYSSSGVCCHWLA